ncbi:LLM class flavin-dependent oxidoreductase [Xanthomonas arboricola]|uniref:LLM class flavin-dependent oxidoreductase n=1 Tax=Xanthomonas arboricola TaxID=56448 RepID=UPI0025AFCCEC|nr:LLM class flavin-dependent oxidoreductase [Xanthomonas arboricola]MDN0207945.1 LLM class flavin-dependent oxidoreductase [Xanthomonas arboricola pv. corylina]MDN0212415.1 LLM class flavin-dependent oxidoreductase [Xanthomonas arboricola pv. corylina]
MSVDDIIKRCAEQDIILKIEDGALHIEVRSPPKDRSLLLELKQRRDHIEQALLAGSDHRRGGAGGERPTSMSLFYFSSDEGSSDRDKYRLLLDGARFADEHGFEAVWTPERHFARFGGLYPNPALMASALAAVTRNVALRAGSVVLPLNDPLRVAEEWAVVDNLSDGRAGVAFASGWQPNDFVLAPDVYPMRHQFMYDGIEQIRTLWSGGTITRRNGAGDDIAVSCLPRPIQPELPIWITAATSPQTFESAGRIGANVLSHLTGQTPDALGEKIKIYRKARAEAGYTTPGQVTVMIHTFISSNQAQVLQVAKEPFKRYLSHSIDLLSNLASQVGIDPKSIGSGDMETLLEHAFHRYHATSALLGTPDSALEFAARLRSIGVDEIACLVDFGIDPRVVLENLPHLNQLKTAVAAL